MRRRLLRWVQVKCDNFGVLMVTCAKEMPVRTSSGLRPLDLVSATNLRAFEMDGYSHGAPSVDTTCVRLQRKLADQLGVTSPALRFLPAIITLFGFDPRASRRDPGRPTGDLPGRPVSLPRSRRPNAGHRSGHPLEVGERRAKAAGAFLARIGAFLGQCFGQGRMEM